MECSYEDNIRQSIYLIVMTKKGERVMRPDFGCDIHQHMFAALDYTTLTMMKHAVEEALVRWEPRITDINVKVENRMQKENAIQIEIAYRVRTTNNPFNLVFPFYLQET
ncbi:MAG: GPW/gp25 family protein [Lachnospiraceae bacterium]|nr:GPW/gp25 family protein [Lachnospiraceae bacterium]